MENRAPWTEKPGQRFLRHSYILSRRTTILALLAWRGDFVD